MSKTRVWNCPQGQDRMKRKNLKVHPDVLKLLERYKDNIHNHMSKRRIPLSWNDFFIAVVTDWECSRSKCHCGTFYDCPNCGMLKKISYRLPEDHL